MQKSARPGIGVFARVSFSRAPTPSPARLVCGIAIAHHPSGRLDAIASNIARMAATENSQDLATIKEKNHTNWQRRARKKDMDNVWVHNSISLEKNYEERLKINSF